MSVSTLPREKASGAVVLCLFGCLLRIVLSDPLLDSIGIHYDTIGEGSFYEKIHPGTVLILLSFFVLLLEEGNPFRRLLLVGKEYTAYLSLLALYVLLFVYMGLRSGFAGLAFLIDTHMTVAVCTLVLSTAPPRLCRVALHVFIVLAACNSIIGIAEAVGRFRVFTFDPSWPVLKEQYFRASALLGHPLNNAMFASVALFVSLGAGYPPMRTRALALLFTLSLVAFGGRAGLGVSLAGLLFLALAGIWKGEDGRQNGTHRIASKALLFLLAPLFLCCGIYLALNTPMGERLAASLTWDASAESRKLAWQVFDVMTRTEILFGVSSDRIVDITYRLNQSVALAEIENPWLMMLLYLGALAFPFWLIATFVFLRRLMRGLPLALKLAVVAYFLIASTSNSFGRKDANYALMVAAVICASRGARDRSSLP